MKRLNGGFLVFVMMVLLSVMSFASEKDVTDKVNEYVNTAKNKEVKVVDKLVSDDANFVRINSIINKKNVHSKSDFLDLVKDGNVCSWASDTNVNIIEVQNSMAVASVEYSNKRLVQTEYLTLVLNDGNWEIVNSVSSLAKK